MRAFEMMMLIFEALAIDDVEKTPTKHCFAQYGYRGSLYDLRLIVEHLCIERKLIDKVFELPMVAWGTPGDNPIYRTSTNFDEQHLKPFYRTDTSYVVIEILSLPVAMEPMVMNSLTFM